MSLAELKKEAEKLGRRLYELRLEISRREGDIPAAREVDFEKYVTK